MKLWNVSWLIGCSPLTDGSWEHNLSFSISLPGVRKTQVTPKLWWHLVEWDSLFWDSLIIWHWYGMREGFHWLLRYSLGYLLQAKVSLATTLSSVGGVMTFPALVICFHLPFVPAFAFKNQIIQSISSNLNVKSMRSGTIPVLFAAVSPSQWLLETHLTEVSTYINDWVINWMNELHKQLTWISFAGKRTEDVYIEIYSQLTSPPFLPSFLL